MITPVPQRVVVAAGEQGRAGRAAKSGRVEARVFQPVLCELVQVRRRHRPAEGRAHAESDVIQQDQDDVRRRPGSLHWLRELLRAGHLIGLTDLVLELEIWTG